MENLVALISDYGLKDQYTGTLKAVIYLNNPDARVVDITHYIRPFDVLDAALKLKWSYKYFPPGTVFLVAVDPDPSAELLIISTEKYYVVCPNNGVASLMLEEEPPESAYIITADHYFLEGAGNFRGRNKLAPIAAQLAKFQSPVYLGEKMELSKLKLFRIPQPRKVSDNVYECVILESDAFGNLVLNMKFNGAEPKEAHVNGIKIQGFSKTFHKRRKGELFLAVNPEGLFQIVAYMSSAAKLLRAGRGTKVRLVF